MAQGGYIKPIIIGVATAVLTAVAFKYLNIDSGGDTAPPQVQTTSSDTKELLQRQKELEARIKQLSQAQLNENQAAMEEQVTKAEQTYRKTRPRTQSVSVASINGAWRDLNGGAAYQIFQDGNFFTIQEFSFGVVSAAGQGSLKGRRGTFKYNTVLGTTGSGTLKVSADNSRINCSFTDHLSQMTLSSVLIR